MPEKAGWRLRPGERIKRTELHAKYGGRQQGGIAPSDVSPNVLIFSGPAGQKYGYFDGWQDEFFHYTGEGQVGDQQLKQGNRALAEHAEMNKSVRLFDGVRGQVTYVGEFEVDRDKPHYTTDAPDVNGEMRKVIVFRLRPLGENRGDLLPIAEEALQERRIRSVKSTLKVAQRNSSHRVRLQSAVKPPSSLHT